MAQRALGPSRSRSRGSATVAKRSAVVAVIFSLALTLAVAPPASAVNIVMDFNSGASDYPSYDPDGSKLVTLMSYVEGYYQDIFEASGTLEVEFYYDNIDALAIHNNTGINISGNPTSCRIRVDTNRTWFIDETPLNNSEFNMVQYLCRDLTSSQKSDYYNGSVPDLLEYAYKGNDNGTGPTESSTGYDMWSVLLHEMGHGLGMTGPVAFLEVSFDEAYDVDPNLVWGRDMEVEAYSEDDEYHLATRSSMYPYSSAGQRVLPSATDIIAIETTANWGDTTIDLFRQDFYSSSSNANFNSRGCWEGNQVPGSADDVWVRHGGDATLSADIRVNNLTIAEGVTVYTGAYQLYADQNCTLGDGTNYARVYVQNGGEFQVDLTLTVANNADVRMDTGSLLDVDSLKILNGGELIGAGTVDIEDSLINRGTITVSGGNLTIDSDVTVNLDGNGDYDGDGQVYVTGGNFSCNKALTDTFNGYFQVNAGRTATFAEGWRCHGVGGGVVNLNGGTSSSTRAKIAGGLFKVAGPINVDKQCEFSCNSEVESTGVITLTDSDDNLYLSSGAKMTILSGATFSGAGRLYGLEGSTIALDDNAVVAVRLRAHGDLIVEEGGIGDVTVNAAFAVSSTSEMIFEASGNGVCDLLDVNGSVGLGGAFTLNFINGYTPVVGDTFTVLNYDSRSGTFASILWEGSFNLLPTYTSTSLTLTVVGPDKAMIRSVPEPGTWALLIGPLAVFWRLRRRRD